MTDYDRQIEAAINYIDRHKSPYTLGYIVEITYSQIDRETGERITHVFPYVFDSCMNAFNFALEQAEEDYRGEDVKLRLEMGSMPYISIDSATYWGTISTYNIWEYTAQEESVYHFLKQ